MNMKFLKKNIKLIKSLALRFREINFIVRKHPNENIRDWEKIIKKFPENVYFDNRFDIYGWLYLSKCIIHTALNCRSAGIFYEKKCDIFCTKNTLDHIEVFQIDSELKQLI